MNFLFSGKKTSSTCDTASTVSTKSTNTNNENSSLTNSLSSSVIHTPPSSTVQENCSTTSLTLGKDIKKLSLISSSSCLCMLNAYEEFNEEYDKDINFKLTPENKKCILLLKEKFRKEIEILQLYNDDTFFLRFASAKKYDYEKAVAMVNVYLKWRSEFDLNRIIFKEKFAFASSIKEFYPHGYFGVDKLGRPIYIERLGQLNVSKVLSIAPLEKVLEYYVQEYEHLLQVILPACSIQRGERIRESFTILDLQGLGWSHFGTQARNIVKKLTSIGQTYYPNTLGRMFIVNCPSVFTMIWSFVKPLLDESTVSKISIFSANENWKEKLLEFVNPEELPDLFGGTNICGNKFYNISFGPWSNKEVIRKLFKIRPSIPKHLFFLSFPEVKNEEELINILKET